MSTSGPSPIGENTHEITILKEQMAEMMRMMQQLAVGGNRESSGPTLEGSAPYSENELRPSLDPNQGHATPPFTPQENNQEVDPPKDKTSKSSYDQVKSQVKTLTDKICIIEGSNARGSVNLDSLTNFPQVIMPPKFKVPKFIKYDGTGDPCTHLHMFCRKMAPYGDNHPLLCQIFPNSLTGPATTWYVRLEKISNQRKMANAFLKYYWFNTEIAPNRIFIQRKEKKSGESFCEYAQRWHELAAQVFPPIMVDKMIKWFIDNHKPPYYEKMINAQVTYFASLIPSGESIDEGIRSKKIVNSESLNSMIEQQVRKATRCKGKEADVHMIDKAPDRPRGVVSAYTTTNA